MVLAGLALVVVGCSDDGDDGGSSTADDHDIGGDDHDHPGPDAPEEMAAAVCAAQPVPGRQRLAEPRADRAVRPGGPRLGAVGQQRQRRRGPGVPPRRGGARPRRSSTSTGVQAFDWEDMSGAGPAAGELFVGDIGDNEGAREEVMVHALRRPRAGPGRRGDDPRRRDPDHHPPLPGRAAGRRDPAGRSGDPRHRRRPQALRRGLGGVPGRRGRLGRRRRRPWSGSASSRWATPRSTRRPPGTWAPTARSWPCAPTPAVLVFPRGRGPVPGRGPGRQRAL